MIDWKWVETARDAGQLKPGDVAGNCVVCNGNLYIGESGRYVARHECPKRVIAGREAADARAANGDDYYDSQRDTPYGQKLEDGFAMVNPDED